MLEDDVEEWEEEWEECFIKDGRNTRWSKKWGCKGDLIWHENWGDDIDAKGNGNLWTDKVCICIKLWSLNFACFSGMKTWLKVKAKCIGVRNGKLLSKTNTNSQEVAKAGGNLKKITIVGGMSTNPMKVIQEHFLLILNPQSRSHHHQDWT